MVSHNQIWPLEEKVMGVFIQAFLFITINATLTTWMDYFQPCMSMYLPYCSGLCLSLRVSDVSGWRGLQGDLGRDQVSFLLSASGHCYTSLLLQLTTLFWRANGLLHFFMTCCQNQSVGWLYEPLSITKELAHGEADRATESQQVGQTGCVCASVALCSLWMSQHVSVGFTCHRQLKRWFSNLIFFIHQRNNLKLKVKWKLFLLSVGWCIKSI